MKRNISPHVQIYKFPITAISSITTRLTGLYLSGAFVGFGILNLTDYDYMNKYKNLNKNLKKAIDYSLIFSSTYHTYGGIRHFIWDKYPKYLINKSVAKSSYFLFGASLVSTVFIDKLLK